MAGTGSKPSRMLSRGSVTRSWRRMAPTRVRMRHRRRCLGRTSTGMGCREFTRRSPTCSGSPRPVADGVGSLWGGAPLGVETIESHEPEVEPGLERLIAALPHQQRVSVLLVHGLQWNHGEVAEVLGVSSSTVATHVSRALEALRRRLGVDTDVQR